jgi:ankyrin repeat protein
MRQMSIIFLLSLSILLISCQSAEKTYSDVYEASRSGDIAAVKTFISKKPYLVNTSGGKSNFPPMHYAVMGNSKEIISFLLSKGANVNAKGGSKEETALQVAAARGNNEMVGFLLFKGANIDTEDKGGRTALLYAMAMNYWETAKFLLNKGASPNQKTHSPEKEITPLFVAIQAKQLDVIKLLIAKGADVNINIKKGFTPLHLAASLGNDNVIKILIEKGATVSAKDATGLTPLDYATKNKHEGTADLLRGLNK